VPAHRSIRQSAILTLQADNTLNNYGNINATGNLTLSAGNSLTNTGHVNVQHNLNVLSPNVTNSGTLASANGNVTFDTPIAAAMNINNANGTVSALNGAINVRDTGIQRCLQHSCGTAAIGCRKL